MTKAEAEDLGDLLENLGETFSIRYVAIGSKEQFCVIRDFAPRCSAERPDLAKNAGQSDRHFIESFIAGQTIMLPSHQ
jgi:hypothetical protein